MGEAPVKKTHSTGVSEEIRKINLMKMKRTMMMKSTMRDHIQTFMMISNDYIFKLYIS